MQAALANPDLISLAAGFVDQQSLPVEATARAVAAVLGDAREGRRALQYGTTAGDLALRTRLLAPPGARGADARRLVRAPAAADGRHDRVAAAPLPDRRGAARPRRHRARRVADLLRLPRRPGDARRAGRRRGDRRRRPAGRRPGGDARRPGGERRARPREADLHRLRARQPDRPEPGRRPPRGPGRAGPAVLDPSADLRPGGRRLPRADVRGARAAERLGARRRRARR